MVSHIKNRHCDVKRITEQQHSDTGFDEVTKKELTSHFVHIVLIQMCIRDSNNMVRVRTIKHTRGVKNYETQ